MTDDLNAHRQSTPRGHGGSTNVTCTWRQSITASAPTVSSRICTSKQALRPWATHLFHQNRIPSHSCKVCISWTMECLPVPITDVQRRLELLRDESAFHACQISHDTGDPFVMRVLENSRLQRSAGGGMMTLHSEEFDHMVSWPLGGGVGSPARMHSFRECGLPPLILRAVGFDIRALSGKGSGQSALSSQGLD